MSNTGNPLVAAIKAADWNTLHSRLVPRAHWILKRWGWAPGRSHQPNAMEVKDLIHEALRRIYVGTQKPDYEPGSDPELAIAIAMSSIASQVAKKLRREVLQADPEPLDGGASGPASPSADDHAEDPRLAHLNEVIKGDDDLGLFVMAVDEYGPKREDIARGLGWLPDKVSVLRKKLRRRLLEANASAPPARQKEDS